MHVNSAPAAAAGSRAFGHPPDRECHQVLRPSEVQPNSGHSVQSTAQSSAQPRRDRPSPPSRDLLLRVARPEDRSPRPTPAAGGVAPQQWQGKGHVVGLGLEREPEHGDPLLVRSTGRPGSDMARSMALSLMRAISSSNGSRTRPSCQGTKAAKSLGKQYPPYPGPGGILSDPGSAPIVSATATTSALRVRKSRPERWHRRSSWPRRRCRRVWPIGRADVRLDQASGLSTSDARAAQTESAQEVAPHEDASGSEGVPGLVPHVGTGLETTRTGGRDCVAGASFDSQLFQPAQSLHPTKSVVAFAASSAAPVQPRGVGPPLARGGVPTQMNATSRPTATVIRLPVNRRLPRHRSAKKAVSPGS
jgi:hypothetical protein